MLDGELISSLQLVRDFVTLHFPSYRHRPFKSTIRTDLGKFYLRTRCGEAESADVFRFDSAAANHARASALLRFRSASRRCAGASVARFCFPAAGGVTVQCGQRRPLAALERSGAAPGTPCQHLRPPSPQRRKFSCEAQTSRSDGRTSRTMLTLALCLCFVSSLCLPHRTRQPMWWKKVGQPPPLVRAASQAINTIVPRSLELRRRLRIAFRWPTNPLVRSELYRGDREIVSFPLAPPRSVPQCTVRLSLFIKMFTCLSSPRCFSDVLRFFSRRQKNRYLPLALDE